MVDDDDGDRFPYLEPQTDSKSAFPREIRAWRRLHIVKRDDFFSLIFFLPEIQYMELELASEGHRGAHEVGGRAQGARPPTLVDRVWAPWSSSLARIFYYFF